MGMFSDLMGRIFGDDDDKKSPEEAAPKPTPEAQPVEGGAPSVDPPERSEAPADAAADVSLEAPVENTPADPAPSPAPIAEVDVEKKLTKMEAEHPEDLDWRRSIVDLMKLVGMDSSYGARKELALELGYSQADIDSKGSAEMNMWLHKEVMKRLAQNGGKVPADLLD